MDQAQKLRGMVQIQKPEHHLARVITVTSGKGGVGKSNVSVNLAILLSRMGKRVIILDADFGLANVEVMLGIRPEYNLADLIFQKKSLSDIITAGPENIGFISGGSGIQEMVNLGKEQLMDLSARLVELDDLADIILIDTGAGISDNVTEFVMSSEEVLLVSTPEPTSITDAYALLKTLNKKSEFASAHADIKLIANRVKDGQGEELYQKMNMVVDKFLNIPLNYLGAIPQDNSIMRAVMMQKPVIVAFPNASASKAMTEIAAKICGMETSVPKYGIKGIAGLFSAIMNRRIR